MCAATFDVGKTGLFEKRFILFQRPFLSLRAGEHVQVLHLRPARAGLIVEQQLFGDQQPAAGRQLVENPRQIVQVEPTVAPSS